MAKIPSLQDLMKAGVHFGHQRSKWYPKMEQYIFTHKNGVHIINLEKTQKMLEGALAFLTETVAGGGTVLFVGTKRQAQAIVKDSALNAGMPYVVNRWLGGTLTNSKSVFGVARKFKKLKEEKASGGFEKYTKKERLDLDREIVKLETLVGGIESMTKMPDAVFIVDLKHEQTALKEATRLGIPVVAICDTNVNPEKADYPIPGNDDATSSVKILVELIGETVKESAVNRHKTAPTVAAATGQENNKAKKQ